MDLSGILQTVSTVSLLVCIGYLVRVNKQERREVMEALMAKNLKDYTQSGIMKDKAKNKEEVVSKEPDLIHESELDSGAFSKLIKQQLKHGRQDSSY